MNQSDDDFRAFCAYCFKSPLDADLLPDGDALIEEYEQVRLYRDALENYWCEGHKHLGKVIDWGSRHNWPLLNLKDGTVGINSDEVAVLPAGAYWWQKCLVVNRNPEIGYLAEGVIDFLDSQQEQAS